MEFEHHINMFCGKDLEFDLSGLWKNIVSKL